MSHVFNDIINLNDIEIRNLEYLDNFRNIVLWGAGVYVSQIIEIIGRERIGAIFDTDEKKHGHFVCGFEVKNPFLEWNAFVDSDTVIVISCASHQYEIAKMVCDCFSISNNRLFAFTHFFAEKYMYSIEDIFKNENEIRKAIDYLADDESKDYFCRTIYERITRNPLLLYDNPCIKSQYEYISDDIRIGVNQQNDIIDCGAFVGDTAELFIRKCNGNCKIYAFEPFWGNYEHLCSWIKDNGFEDRVYARQAFVSDHLGKTMISASNMESVSASEDNRACYENSVDVISIDSLNLKKVDFIKMDIEGAELDAIRGCQSTICKFKPQMMISAYHRVNHLWEIPKLIKETCPEYRIYCGHQPHAAFEPEFYVTI